MDKLVFRNIENKNEVDQYISKVEDYSGVRLPFNYVRNSRLVGAFLHGKLVGGYMLVTKPEFRSVMFVPDQIRNANEFFKKDKFEMMEVNGLWLGKSIKTPKMQFKFWTNVIKDIFFCRKKYLLLMSNKNNKAIERLHDLANPVILHEGSPAILGSQKTYPDIRVAYTTRWKVVLNLPRYIAEIRQREERLSSTFKNRIYART